MKKVISLMLACSVFFAGCSRREHEPVPVYLEDDDNSSFTALDEPLFDSNNILQIIEEFDTDNGLDVIYVPTPQDVVDKMLELAKVQKDDLVYDLGCGDGRIVVTAARRYGCRAVGYDLDPNRVKESLENVEKNNVGHLVRIEQKDIFTLDLSEANVITLYLLPSLNVKLIPQLEKLKPGSRIVSHDFRMKGVKPDKVVKLTSDEDLSAHKIFLWTSPLKKRTKKQPRADADSREEIGIPNIEGSYEIQTTSP
jgi:SAM-dependent methyltransferase